MKMNCHKKLIKDNDGITEKIWNGGEHLTLDEDGLPIFETWFQVVKDGKRYERVYRFGHGKNGNNGIGWHQSESNGKVDKIDDMGKMFPHVDINLLNKMDWRQAEELQKRWVVIIEKRTPVKQPEVEGMEEYALSYHVRGFGSMEEIVHSVYHNQKPIKYEAKIYISFNDDNGKEDGT